MSESQSSLVEIPTRYDASVTEEKWYACWEAAGLFQPAEDSTKPRFCITIPPPNITGNLHMGHCLCYPIQDAIGRYYRLRGYNVLILPGQDHAGIATQGVVDRQLRKEGSSAVQLGREKFIERVWEWRQESGDSILRSFRRLGCAFDWTRNRFTLDEHYANCVRDVFIRWFEEGHIYRGKRVVNWDPTLKTNVSDIETERTLVKGKLYHVRYPFADGSGEVVIATTRPETMLADVAVAVHPSDTRYQGLIGKEIRLPLTNRLIPLIADTYPDPAFGTGAVKITPAHDANDYEVGVRHNLPMPVVLDAAAQIKLDELGDVPENVRALEGLSAKTARAKVVEALSEQGFLVKEEDHEIALVLSERTKDVIEPLLSEQWFLNQTRLAPPAIAAVREGRTRFTPDRYNDIFIQWMENIRDWNISRQLWWGHRVPVYYTADGTPFAARSWEEAQAKAGDEPIVRQDDDVLDTWFSSGLWPFVTLGWPEGTADYTRFYPTDVLVTDRSIINLWVARMMMMGLELTGREPFHDVIIHATVLNEQGKRMSKSLGTGVDPVGVLDSLGADVLRWTLQSQSGTNQEIKYSDKRNEQSRNFISKIWNATRFVRMKVGEAPSAPGTLEPVDEWLLTRLAETETTVRRSLDQFHFANACDALYEFFWVDLCDWYIEDVKRRLDDPATRQTPAWVLMHSIKTFLILVHPIMPFVSEELWSYLRTPSDPELLMAASWPTELDAARNESATARIEHLKSIVKSLRLLRAQLAIPSLRNVAEAYVNAELSETDRAFVQRHAWVESLKSPVPAADATNLILTATTEDGLAVGLPIRGNADVADLIAKTERLLETKRKEVQNVVKRLSDPNFVANANPAAVEKAREDQANGEATIQGATDLLAQLRAQS